MNKNQFVAKIDWLTAQNRLLGLAVVVMLIFNVMNWYSLQKAQAETNVTIVPIGGGQGMTIGNGKASEEYLRAMARYLTMMLGNYTAGTLRQQLQEVLDQFAPESVGEAQKSFEAIARQVERYPSIASRIRWSGQKPLKYTDSVIQVQTIKERLVSGRVKDPKTVFYCIEYRIDETRFWVLNIREKEGEGDNVCMRPTVVSNNQ